MTESPKALKSSLIQPYVLHLESARDFLGEISKRALDMSDRKRPCGFFHHTGMTLERLQDVGQILERMEAQRRRLSSLDRLEHRLNAAYSPVPAGTPLPPEIQNVMRAQERLTQSLKLDFETLYLFGMMLLDQWAITAICVAGIRTRRKKPFYELVDAMANEKFPILGRMWGNQRASLLWLFHNFRVFRNVFITHVDRPWQRGTGRSIFGTSFNMFIPSPPGQRTDELELDREIMGLLHLAPEHIRSARPDYWERARPMRLLEVLFDQIGTVASREDRNKIEILYRKRGGSTPTFQTVGIRILEFVSNGLCEVLEILKDNPVALNLDYVQAPQFPGSAA